MWNSKLIKSQGKVVLGKWLSVFCILVSVQCIQIYRVKNFFRLLQLSFRRTLLQWKRKKSWQGSYFVPQDFFTGNIQRTFCTRILVKVNEFHWLPLQVRQGMAQWSDGREKPQPIKIVLTEERLILQREEMVYTQTDSEQMDHALLTKVSPELSTPLWDITFSFIELSEGYVW